MILSTTLERAAIILIGLAVLGCPKISQQSAAAESLGLNVTATRSELRILAHDLAQRFAGTIETVADSILSGTDDADISRQAVLWQAYATPAVYDAALLVDPMGSLADLWVLAFQMEDYFETGPGKEIFGEFQPLAIDAAHQMQRAAALLANRVIADTVSGDTLRLWASQRPIQSPLFIRESASGNLAAAMAGRKSSGAFATLGTIEDRISDMSYQLKIMNNQLPKQISWQGSLLIDELFGLENLRNLLQNADTLMSSAGELMVLAANIEPLIERERNIILAAVEEERIAALVDVDRQRRATLEAVSLERIALLEGLHDEIGRLLAAVETEREATLAEAETIAVTIVDHAIWRVVQVLAGLVIVAALGGFILLRELRQ